MMLLVPYTSKKRVFTEGPNTYFCVGKDGPSVPNSLQKSDFYVRIAHPHVCSCLRRTHIKMEIQKKNTKKTFDSLPSAPVDRAIRGRHPRICS